MSELAGEARDEVWPSPMRAWWAVLVLALAAVVSYTDRQALSLLVDPIRADLHVRDSQIGLVQGLAFVLVYGVAGLPLGRLADVAPRRWVLVAGVLVWSGSTILCGLAPDFPHLFAARVGVGIGEAVLAPAGISLIGDLFPPRRRGSAIGVFITGMVVGSGAAVFLGGMLMQWTSGNGFRVVPLLGALAPWRATLVLLGLAGPIMALGMLTVREPERRNRSAAGIRPPLATVMGEFARRGGVLFPLYLAMACLSVGDAAVGAWAPVFLSRDFHASPRFIGLWLGLSFALTGLAGSLLGGALADRVVRRGGVRGRLALAAVAALLAGLGAGLAFATSPAEAVLFCSVWALLSALAATIGITAVQEAITNDMRGLAVAFNSLGNILLGVGTGSSLTAFLTDHVFSAPSKVGWSIATVLAPFGLLSAFLFTWARVRTKATRHDFPP